MIEDWQPSEGLTLDTSMNDWAYDPGWTENDWQSGFDLPGGGDSFNGAGGFNFENQFQQPFQDQGGAGGFFGLDPSSPAPGFYSDQGNTGTFDIGQQGSSGTYFGLDPSNTPFASSVGAGGDTTGFFGNMSPQQKGSLLGLIMQFVLDKQGSRNASKSYNEMMQQFMNRARPAGAAGNPGQPEMGPNARSQRELLTQPGAFDRNPIYQQLVRDFEKQLSTRLAGPGGQGLMSGSATMRHTGGLSEIMERLIKMFPQDQIYQGNEAEMSSLALQPRMSAIGVNRSSGVNDAASLKRLIDILSPQIFGNKQTNTPSLATRIFG